MKLDKAQLAHEYALKMIEQGYLSRVSREHIAFTCFELADAMQAEADKRVVKGVPDVLSSTNSTPLDWQPDWSQAPDGYDFWAFDGFSKSGNWYKTKPYLDDDSDGEDEWNIELSDGIYKQAPDFGYVGDWKDSLRKRPEGR